MPRHLSGLGLSLACALVAAGCSITTGGGASDANPGADGGASNAPGTSNDPNGASPDGGASSGKLSFLPANVAPDASLEASGDWTFNSDLCGSTEVTLDTAKGEVSCMGQPKGSFTFQAITQPDTSMGSLTAALFVTKHLVIEAGMVVHLIGNRPLVIVALESASIQGTLRGVGDLEHAVLGGFDGSLDNEPGNGPGGGVAVSGGRGAGGGSFCGAGGSNGSRAPKTYGNAKVSPLVGGSAGGAGITRGSTGGGAIEIVAGTSIEVSFGGVIAVPGGGGEQYSAGGGAGGAILLEAPTVSVFGTLAANGAGGGSGTGAVQTGSDGTSTNDPAPGGLDSFGGGSGGSGSAGPAIAGQDAPEPSANNVTQGGGGGGAGWIRINTRSGNATIGSSAVISPSLATPCASQGVSATH